MKMLTPGNIHCVADHLKETTGRLRLYRMVCRLTAILLAATFVYIGPKYHEWLFILLVELLGLWLEQQALRLWALHRRMRNCALIGDSFGCASYEDLWGEVAQEFHPDTLARLQRVPRQPDRPYYSSNLPPGNRRFLENMAESIFFTEKLQRHRYFDVMRLPLIAGVGVIGFLILVPYAGVANIATTIILILLLVITGIDTVRDFLELRHYQPRFAALAQKSKKLATQPGEPAPAEIHLLFSEYSLLSLSAPAVPRRIFLHKEGELAADWRT